jgi:D-alanyl-D-alanine carboxypeptidase
MLPTAGFSGIERTAPLHPGVGLGLGLFRSPLPCGTRWGHDGAFAGYASVALNTIDGNLQVVVFVNSLTTTLAVIITSTLVPSSNGLLSRERRTKSDQLFWTRPA